MRNFLLFFNYYSDLTDFYLFFCSFLIFINFQWIIVQLISVSRQDYIFQFCLVNIFIVLYLFYFSFIPIKKNVLMAFSNKNNPDSYCNLLKLQIVNFLLASIQQIMMDKKYIILIIV